MKDENSVALRTLIEFASEHPEGKVIFHQLASLVDTGNLVYLKALETFLLEIFTHESE